jgi:thiamine kinase-like enzyme
VQGIEETIVSLRPDWRPDEIEVVSYLEGGYSNRNYRIRYAGCDYVVRIPEATQPFVDRAHESNWFKKLPASVGPVPLAHDAQTGAMLSEWVTGILLVDHWQDHDSESLVHYLHTLHRSLPDAGRVYPLNSLVRQYGVHEFNVRPSAVGGTCHNDLNPWNILVTETGWVTLDWEFVGHHDPLFDLVGLHQGLALPMHELSSLADLYQDLTGTSDPTVGTRMQACLFNFWLREYGWAQHQLALGNDRQEVAEQRETALEHLRSGL